MAWPLLVAGGVAAAGAIISGVVQANAAAAAAKKQETAAERAMRLQSEMYGQQRADMEPWREAGRSTLSDLLNQMRAGSFDTNIDPSQIANDPGYQFRMAEGQKALERSAAARGGLLGGATLKGITRYGQDFASNEFGNAWNRNQTSNMNRFNRLSSIAGFGQNAAQSMNAASGQHAGNMGNLYGAQGNAQAAGQIGVGNAVGGAIQGASNSFASMLAPAYMASMGGGGGGGGGSSGGMQYIPPPQPIPQQNGYQGGTVPGRSANLGVDYSGFGMKPW